MFEYLKYVRNILPVTFKQFVKYGLVGVLNIALYWSVFEILTRVYHVFYVNANVWANVVTFFNGLFFNRAWTFKSQTHWFRDALYFAVIAVVCTIVQTGTLVVLVERFNFDPHLAKYFGIVVFASLNFTLNKFITYRKRKLKEPTEPNEDEDDF